MMSTEEMKNKPSSILVEDTDEIMGWRTMSQLDVDECWKKITGKMKEEVLNKYKVEDSKKEHTEVDVRPWNGDAYEEARNTGYVNGVKTVGQGEDHGETRRNTLAKSRRRRRKEEQ